MNLENIKLIVFDLDGTLYEDTHHFDYYAEQIKKKLPLDKQEAFLKDYHAVLDDKHTLKIGRVYDIEKDLILVQLDGKVREAYKWDGIRLSSTEVQELYPELITFDRETMCNVGDLWWVPNSIGRHYGLTGEQAQNSFIETREFMMTDEFVMNPVPLFKETLESIRDHVKLVLLTNSPQPDSEQIINKLGLSEVFHQTIFEGRKPSLTKERFTEIKNAFNVEFTAILSIGDNYINEILPAKKLGCRTLFIDPHQLGMEESADKVVKNIAETIPVLEQFKN